MTERPSLLSTSGAARACGCSEMTMRRLEVRGIVSPIRDSVGRRLFSAADIERVCAHLAANPRRGGFRPAVAAVAGADQGKAS